MRIYNGHKPCAGCGKPGSEVPRLGVELLCSECRELIELGKGVRTNSDGFSTLSLYPHTFKRLRYTELDDAKKEIHHRTEDFFYVSDEFGKAPAGSSNQLVKDFGELLTQMDEGKKVKNEIQIWMDDAFGRNTYTVRTPVAKAMFKFLGTLAKWGKRVEEESYNRGKNLLIGLASGEMSIKEFNERA